MAGEAKKTCCNENKLCALTCCPCKIDVEKLKPLVNAPKFICKSCGRVANSDANLCQPEPIK